MQRPGLRPHSPVTISQSMTRRVPSIRKGTSTAECPAMEFASRYSARLHRRSPDRRSLGDGPCLIAIQLPTRPSDRLNVPASVFPDNRPTALRVMPFPAPTECNVPSGSTCPLAQPRLFLSERNLAHGAGITLQFVRPDIRQSCILLAAVKSWASHSPSARIATAIASPAIAPRRFPPCSGSVISRSAPKNG